MAGQDLTPRFEPGFRRDLDHQTVLNVALTGEPVALPQLLGREDAPRRGGSRDVSPDYPDPAFTARPPSAAGGLQHDPRPTRRFEKQRAREHENAPAVGLKNHLELFGFHGFPRFLALDFGTEGT
jgi:hypothetical protein